MKTHLVVLILAMVLVFPACSVIETKEEPEILDRPPEQLPRIGRDPLSRSGAADKTARGKTASGQVPEIASRSTPEPRSSHEPMLIARLTEQAKTQVKHGQLDHAFATTERALRINPSDPHLWNLLAQIQLKRGNIHQAEQLARKSNLLAERDRRLQAENWRIIADALKRKGAVREAEEALRKARELD